MTIYGQQNDFHQHVSAGAMEGMPMATGMGDMGMTAPTGMTMAFFNAEDTTLFATAWTPSNIGQYAGTCIFLVAFTVVFRALLALRSSLEATAWSAHRQHHLRLIDGDSGDAKIRDGIINATWAARPPWQLRIDGWRAVLDTTLVGIGYLLMLAVMTMNVGYFLSVLAGTFAGSVMLGRFTQGGIAC